MPLPAAISRRLNPVAVKRLRRFFAMRRAAAALILLSGLYVVSLFSEFVANGNPLYLRYNGRSYLPVFRFYPEDTFTGNGNLGRPNYRRLGRSAAFAPGSGNFMIFAPIPYGPNESLDRDDIEFADIVSVRLVPEPRLGTVNVRPDLSVARTVNFDFFAGGGDLRDGSLNDRWPLPAEIRQAIAVRFANEPAGPVEAAITTAEGRRARVSLSTYRQRRRPPKTVRLTFREATEAMPEETVVFNPALSLSETAPPAWRSASAEQRAAVVERVKDRYRAVLDPVLLKLGNVTYRARFQRTDFRFPFRPTTGHPLGLDSAGRDVLARLLYGVRTSLTFAICLVICSMTLGITVGALEGYYGGVFDITMQRLIEIWSALPFLYIMILMGNLYGRSLPLLLFCYAIFNWIGISYYVRAEFLRLRRQPFVEAANCLGLPAWKIIFRHILPNGLVPVITFFPFSLVGAVGVLTALDYLGFGLPPPTPSWGALLAQAQEYSWAWWLVLYPTLALFVVMLLGVFVGEGVRAAYDPKRFSRME